MEGFFRMSLQLDTPAKNTHLKTLLALAGMSLIALMWMESGTGAVLDDESVCVTVTVIGMDGFDPGTPYCDVPIASSVLSSSVSSSLSSSVASVSSAVSSAAGASSARASEGNGGRRHSVSRSRLRILRLLEEWTRGNERPHAAAPALPFEDVPADAWYRPYLADLYDRGWISPARLFRPAEGATRAEVAKLLVLSFDMEPVTDAVAHFDDVPEHAWFFGFIEKAAENNWILGYDNCYGTRPCIARPTAAVTRAEGAALVIRAFGMESEGAKPVTFIDVPSYAWYVPTIEVAVLHCILKGDDGANAVRPDDIVNRAEIVTMIWRAASGGCDAQVLSQTESDEMRTTVASIDGGMIPSASDETCMTGAWACAAEAMEEDMRTVFTFGSGSFIPALDDMHATAPTDSAGWAVGAAAVAFISAMLFIAGYILKRHSAIRTRVDMPKDS